MSTHAVFALLALALLLGSTCCGKDEQDSPKQTVVWHEGEGGYHTYRIPALIVTKAGTLLAFCEGRRHGLSDTGEINTLLRRSFDGGKTWGPVQIVAGGDGPNTFGNPCPVVDQKTGTILLLLTHNLGADKESEMRRRTSKGTRTVWITRSTNDGATWSKLVDITASTKKANWTWYATGPGVGIQLKSGRLMIPCDHNEADTMVGNSHVIYSDDGGETWMLGGTAGPRCNECQIVELEDGGLMLNMRSHKSQLLRNVSVSADGGLTWSAPKSDPTLIEPVCQASFLRYTEKATHGKSRLLFSNPASLRRNMMTVRMSYDEGKTWPVMKLLDHRWAAYSCLTVMPDMEIGLLYECGDDHSNQTITFARFGLDWLTDGKDIIK